MGADIPVLKPGCEITAPHEPQPRADETARKLYADAQPALVKITTDRGGGTGFFAGKDGQILTNAHMVAGSRELHVTTSDGKRYKAEITAMDEVSDIAVMKIKDGSVKPQFKELQLGAAATLKPDQSTYAIGVPAEYNKAYVSPGYFRSLNSFSRVVLNTHPEYGQPLVDALKTLPDAERADLAAFLKHPILQVQQASVAGLLGGPLLDSSGKVVGIARVNDGVTESTYFSSAEAAKLLLAAEKKFDFKYAYHSTPWTENYLTMWQDNKLAATGCTLAAGTAAGALGIGGALAMRYIPRVTGLGIGVLGATMLTSDASEYLNSTDSRDSLKFGLASLADTSTTSGALLSMIPRARTYGMALVGVGLAGRLATEFIKNQWTLEETTRTDGSNRPPFDGHRYLR